MGKEGYSLYQEKPTEDQDLQQGDIVENNEKIHNIFTRIYPQLSDLEYGAFLVITQSCDLVRRDGKPCKSEYVNFVPIQPLEQVFLSLLDRVYERYRIARRLYSAIGKNNAIQLIDSICNQNAWALGVFFLHSNIDVKIPVDSVALLQASYAVPSELCYNNVARARSGRLNVVFQSRLGWLVGNLYSRVATPDFPESYKKDITDYLVRSSDKENKNLPQWLKKAQIQKLKSSTESDLLSLSEEQIDCFLADFDPKAPVKKAINHMVNTVKNVIEDVKSADIEKIEKELHTNMEFELLFR